MKKLTPEQKQRQEEALALFKKSDGNEQLKKIAENAGITAKQMQELYDDFMSTSLEWANEN